MKGGDRRRRKESVYLLLSFIFPLSPLSHSLSAAVFLRAPAAKLRIDSHRHLTAAKKRQRTITVIIATSIISLAITRIVISLNDAALWCQLHQQTAFPDVHECRICGASSVMI